MVAPRRRTVRWITMSLGVIAALGLLTGWAAAVEPVDHPPEGPFVDVAVVQPDPSAVTPDSPVLLLAVHAHDPSAPGAIVLDLVQTDGTTWTTVDTLEVDSGLDSELDAAGDAMLIPLGRQFGLVAGDALAGRTFVGLIGITPFGIHLEVAKDLQVDRVAAGAADVDGDGTPELVLVGEAQPDGTGGCEGSPLVVMNGSTLRESPWVTIPGIGLDGAAVGRFGKGLGDDLIAYTHDSCNAERASSPNGVIVVDLPTGRLESMVGNGRLGIGDPTGPLTPLVADLDRDGIDEPIIRTGPAVFAIDPAQGWQIELIDEDAIPIAVVDAADRPRLVVATPASGPVPASIRLLALGRVGRGGELIERGLTAVAVGSSDPRAAPTEAIERATDPAAPPPAWVGELGATGCRTVLVPGATIQGCTGTQALWSSQAGPAWLQTAPLLEVGSGVSRRLLLASGVGWATPRLGLAAPGPAAGLTARASRWRTGPSSPFELVAVEPGSLLERGAMAAPSLVVDPDVGSAYTPTLRLAGPTGTRVLVRLGPVLALEPDIADEAASTADPPVGLGDFVITPPTPGYGTLRVVPATGPPDGGPAELPVIVPLPMAQDFPTTAWSVTLVGLSPFGEPSPIRSGRIALDLTGPGLTFDEPFGSLPWPFHDSIRGLAEPGALVGLADGPIVVAGPDGRFALDAVLAPWPQDLAVRATDRHGNTTSASVSLVGGIDYRQLPWQPIVIVSVLVAALVSTLVGPLRLGRGGRSIRAAEAASAPTAGPDPASEPARRDATRVDAARGDAIADIEDLPRPPRGAPG